MRWSRRGCATPAISSSTSTTVGRLRHAMRRAISWPTAAASRAASKHWPTLSTHAVSRSVSTHQPVRVHASGGRRVSTTRRPTRASSRSGGSTTSSTTTVTTRTDQRSSATVPWAKRSRQRGGRSCTACASGDRTGRGNGHGRSAASSGVPPATLAIAGAQC